MVYFREAQQFRQWWLWMLLVVPAAMGIWRQRLPWVVLLLLAAPLWFWFLRLITEVRDDGVHLHFFLLWKKRVILFHEIRSAQARTYRPLMEYGGWGIRWGLSGQAYNVSGNQGVQLELAGGKRLLIGSQRPEELESAIQSRISR